jgi:hypothetical protein
LPIGLLFFDARLFGDSLVFTWQTSFEHNVDRFEGQVAPLDELAGTFNTIVSWHADGDHPEGRHSSMAVHLDDAGIVPGRIYYARLRSVDRDGREQFSPLVSVYIDREAREPDVRIMPNPVASGSELRVESTNILRSIRVRSLEGRVLVTASVSGSFVSSVSLDMRLLPPGIYWVEVTQADGRHMVRKLVVQ